MQKINGNTDGIRRSYLAQLEAIFNMEMEKQDFCPVAVIEVMAAFTGVTGREVMIYIDRAGRVETVYVGGQDRVSLPALNKRRSENRLCGIRCIHTHPGGNGGLSDVDIQSLKNLRLDAMAAVGVAEGKPTFMQVGILSAWVGEGEYTVNLYGPYTVDRIPDALLWGEIELADDNIRPPEAQKAEAEIARTLLVGIGERERESLEELKQLADTAGFITVGRLFQPRAKPDTSTYLGQGKMSELVLEIQRLNADAVIFDDELSPGQIRNIQKILGKTEIIDRTALILDIFAGRASTHEGRLQVELAQTKYMLPRMTGFWTHLNRMGGGGGGGGGARRGEGETQLEVDRRILRRRIDELEREIDKVKTRREVQRVARERSNIPVVALVGYTNAGKSTLMNCLSGSDVLAEDKLFATLDPISRRVNYGSGEFLLVDTVGFIDKLPHDLVNAFRATLEEAKYADLLLHVIDASAEGHPAQMAVVDSVLKELGAGANPVLTLYNKCDIAPNTPEIAISAKAGLGLEKLKAAITQSLANLRAPLKVLLPLNAGGTVSRIYEVGKVQICDYRDDGIYLEADVPLADATRIKAGALEVYG
ncbi:MAG: GTPase HflX [Defluviitaleaceae bacterium]|nr:GTPase HflX [Defluviitaleaceae bacterium]MCL2239871.1 GTPase HflX [Defluviitaleaceae bacterium]